MQGKLQKIPSKNTLNGICLNMRITAAAHKQPDYHGIHNGGASASRQKRKLQAAKWQQAKIHQDTRNTVEKY